ncbi:MAG: acetyl-CoA hydrolase/transferase C-terminal domain-containing protein [Dehalococcoidia bacterium]|nr:acetyl-CoA hydrolase/transferase C-terminal domain-containing protein [Dehalococcoidia bacterium]
MITNWREEYRRKTVTPEEAVKVVKTGDRVAFAYGLEPNDLALAMMSRAGDVRDVKLYVPAPGRDFPWYEAGWEDVFDVSVGFVLPVARGMIQERRGDYMVSGLLWAEDPSVREPVDVLLVYISTPDEHGYCSLGASLWDKKKAIQEAKVVLAEVSSDLIRTSGENYVHVSEIDYFVEHTPTGKAPGVTDILGRKTSGPGKVEKAIAGYVGELVHDGDTFEIGVGGAAEWVLQLGVLDDKNDLGIHSENLPKGMASLVMNGIATGRFKTINPGKVVSTACGGGTKEEMDFINQNPLFELHPSSYVLDPRTIAAHDNMVSINSALAVDLTGQIAAESVGPTMVSGTGGQLAFAMGACLSRGGRNVTVLRSTAKGGTMSGIVAQLDPGTVVSVPRNLADLVVTEYGVARLRGKTQRQRAAELINASHPDYRAELARQAQRLFGGQTCG